MKLGAVFPFTDVHEDPCAIRDFVQAVDDMGYDHIVVYDHVLGSNPASRPGFSMPFTHLSVHSMATTARDVPGHIAFLRDFIDGMG